MTWNAICSLEKNISFFAFVHVSSKSLLENIILVSQVNNIILIINFCNGEHF